MKNLVIGSKVKITEPYFTGSFRNPMYAGDRTFYGEIINDKYGLQGKHWFTILIIKSEDPTIKVGRKIRRQGKNIYSNCEILEQPEDIEIKTQDKYCRKHTEAYFYN